MKKNISKAAVITSISTQKPNNFISKTSQISFNYMNKKTVLNPTKEFILYNDLSDLTQQIYKTNAKNILTKENLNMLLKKMPSIVNNNKNKISELEYLQINRLFKVLRTSQISEKFKENFNKIETALMEIIRSIAKISSDEE